ncbi:MAG: CdaR family protein [Candidatus Dormibacteraeota bacterium]|nr:CdaR family protein [Candidatus Dormibacteraeota bacterium]
MSWIAHNWQLKLLALVLSLGLFSAVAFAQNPIVIVQVNAPISFDNLSPGQSIYNAPSTQPVNVTGTAQNVRIAGRNSVSVHVDCTRLKNGTQQVVGRPRVAVPNVNTLEDQLPFSITVDDRATVGVPIETRINYSEGWKPVTDKIVVTPNKLSFVGAASQLKDVRAFVQPASPVGASSADIPSLPIQLEKNGRPFTIPSDTIPATTVDSTLNASLHVEAVKPNQTRRVPLVETPTGSPAPGYRITAITIDPLFVDVSGSIDDLSNINSVSLPALAVDGLSTTVTRRVPVNQLPANVTSGTGAVNVTITIAKNPVVQPSPTAVPTP